MPEGKMRLFDPKFKGFIVRPDKKCLIQSHCHEPLFHIEGSFDPEGVHIAALIVYISAEQLHPISVR